MSIITIKTTDADGKLTVELPAELRNIPLEVSIRPAQKTTTEMTRAEYLAFLDRVAGSVDDPDFKRPERGGVGG
jgi:hypothetical protein